MLHASKKLIFCFFVALTVINGKIAPKLDLQPNTTAASSTVPPNADEDELDFLDSLEFQYAIPGQDYLVKCKVQGSPIPVVVWRKNGTVIITNDKYVVQNDGLLIKNARKSDDGVYQCETTDLPTGQIQVKNININVIPPRAKGKIPEQIPQVEALSITATTITWKIDPPEYSDTLPINTFLVRYKPEEETSWDLAKNCTWRFGYLEDDPSYVLKDLVPKRTYHFQFAASNDVGRGPFTDGPTITMRRRGPPEEPKIDLPDHTTEENTNTTEDVIVVSPHFELKWQVPDDNGDPIDSYLIRYCVVQKINGSWRNDECSEEINRSQHYTSYELDALKCDTIYSIELRAHNSIGFSLPTQIRVKTGKIPHQQCHAV